MNSISRLITLLCVGGVVICALATAAGWSEVSEWERARKAIDPSSMEGSFFDGTPEEVATRIDNLVLLRVDPVQRSVSYENEGPVSKSVLELHAFSPDMNQVFGLKLTCTGSCSGNGCGVTGCNIVGGDCSPCNCTGTSCSGTCTCTKTSEFIPESGRDN